MPNSPYRIIAIDPGYGRVGVAILEKNNHGEKLIFSECFETAKEDTGPKRLSDIKHHIKELIKTYKPEALAIEALFFGKNKKTALAVAEARGVILSEASTQGLDIFEYKPASIKVAVTGHGASDKRQVQAMVERILSPMKKIAHDDEYDAIAVGLTHLATHKTI